MTNFRQLRQFRILNGHCNILRKHGALGDWVMDQRMFYVKLALGREDQKLNPIRILPLESIGFSFGKQFTAVLLWAHQLGELKKYKKRMQFEPPIDPTNPTPLAKWVSWQRYEYLRFQAGLDTLLAPSQIKQLNELKFKWKGPRLPFQRARIVADRA